MGNQKSVADLIRRDLSAYLKRDMDGILPDHSLRDDLGLDSMATIELLYRIEEAFDLQIPDQDLQQLVTVGDVVAYVEGKLRPISPSRSARPSLARSSSRKKKR